MKIIKLKLDEETAWLANVHPSKRLEIIKQALKSLDREELLRLLGVSEEQRDKSEMNAGSLQELENW